MDRVRLPTTPQLLLGLIIYGYATGVFSSRKLERATYDSVAFRFIAANEHHDHDTIAAFRRRFLKQIERLFEVLGMAREMGEAGQRFRQAQLGGMVSGGVLKMGTVALDGTKIHANASRHSALSYEHAAPNSDGLLEWVLSRSSLSRRSRCPPAAPLAPAWPRRGA